MTEPIHDLRANLRHRAVSVWRHFAARPPFTLALIGALVMAVVVLLLRPPEPAAPVGMQVPAAPSAEVKKTPKVTTPIKTRTVQAYPAAVKNKLKLPETALLDPAVAVIAASQVTADDHPQTLTTTLNTDTGEVETYARRDPLPWLARDYRGEAGVILGLKNGEPAVRLEARQNVFQVKAVHFGGYGSVEQTLNTRETDWMIGVGAWYRW